MPTPSAPTRCATGWADRARPNPVPNPNPNPNSKPNPNSNPNPNQVCNRLGGATASLGFMFSSFAIAQLISNAWLGPLSDAVGRKAILTLTLSGA